MHNRRKLIVALGAGALTAPFVVFAQQQSKVWRIGVLGTHTATSGITANRLEALRAGLRELGYIEGKNLVIEYRWAEGKDERFPDLAAELVRLNVDLIVANGGAGPRAAVKASSTIPVVVMDSGDLVAMGLAASLARPGGNLTGQIFFVAELAAKRVEFLKEAVPRMTQVAILDTGTDQTGQMGQIAATAKHLKIRVPRFVVQGEPEFRDAFAAMVKQRVDALAYPDRPALNTHAKAIADLALKHRLPSAGSIVFAEAGGMIGYGVNFVEMSRRTAVFIDKIFKGAKPGDIPIEQATKFDIVVNMKTARALGITIPHSILVRADRVIE